MLGVARKTRCGTVQDPEQAGGGVITENPGSGAWDQTKSWGGGGSKMRVGVPGEIEEEEEG